MYIIIIFFAGKIVIAAVLIKFTVNLLKIPRVIHKNSFRDHLGRWRALLYIFHDPLFKPFKFRLIYRMIAVKVQIILHSKSHGRAPNIPTGQPPSFAVTVKSRTQK
jgi:hypothetical protein